MGDVIYWLCADLFVLGTQLSSAPLPSPGELRQRLLSMLDHMVGAGRAAGVPDSDISEARYALVAFLDEQVLKSDWAGRSEWMSQPLQLLLYREYTAGENFFARMNALLQQGGRQNALQVYYVCLLLGFRGAYAAGGREHTLAGFADAARNQISPALPPPAQISPHATPRDRQGTREASRVPFVALMVGCAFVLIAALTGFALSLRSTTTDAIQSMSTPLQGR